MRGLARQAAPSTPPCAAGSYGQHRNPSMRGLARQAAPSTSPCADEPSRSKRPGDRGQCRGTTTEHRSSPWAPHQPKLARNSGTRTLCSAPKRCNSNDAISMFEIHVGELRATFLRNHNMRRHIDPKRKTTQAEDNSSRRQLKPRRPPHPRPPQLPEAQGRCTRYGALHPIRGAAPEKGHYTRYGALHPNRRGALPTDRVQCPNTQEQTRNWHTEPLTAAPLHAQLGPTGGRMGTAPTPPPALRPTPTPPTPLNAKSRLPARRWVQSAT